MVGWRKTDPWRRVRPENPWPRPIISAVYSRSQVVSLGMFLRRFTIHIWWVKTIKYVVFNAGSDVESAAAVLVL